MNEYPYIYRWSNTDLRASLYMKRCKIITKIDRWYWVVEFEDGGRLTTLNCALKKDKV